MKKLSENIFLGIFQGVASLLGILTLVFTFLPAYFENDQPDMSIFQIMLGNERIPGSGLLVFGFVLLILGILASIVLTILLFSKKSNRLLTTILAVSSIVLTLAGAIILTCAIFISGLDKLNSELGFVQGSWGIRAGNILVPVFALLAAGFSYPCALVIPHHQDMADKEKGDVKEAK